MNIDWLNFFSGSLPLWIILGTAFVVLILGLFIPKKSTGILLVTSIAGIAAAFYSSLQLWTAQFYSVSNMLTVDRYGYFLYNLILFIGLLSLLTLYDYFEKQAIHIVEIYSLFLFCLFGLMLMVSTTHLFVFFIALEIMSLALYVLVGIKRNDSFSNEAALKYFLLGAVAAGFLLFGTALFYGATGTFDLKNIEVARIAAQDWNLFKVAITFIFIAFAFKVAAVPFHFWTPDVYEGAPSPITGFMSTAVKVAAFGALIRMLAPLSSIEQIPVMKLLTFFTYATLIVANLVALSQTNIKRMLAYSSIAHAGYVLLGICAVYASNFEAQYITAPVFYLFAYSLITLGAFAIVSALAGTHEDFSEITHYAGLSKRAPLLAALLSVFMIALTGIPPTVGFVGKYLLFKQAFAQGLAPLVICALIMSAVSAYYYLRVIVAMYFGSSSNENEAPLKVSGVLLGVILFCAISVFLLGFAPSSYLENITLSKFLPSFR